MKLPTDKKLRKDVPLATGLLDYFPDALADVARLSKVGNDQHNPGQPLHWAREKSTDHADCIMRHMLERDAVDTDGVLHATKVAWRALAQVQLLIEKLKENGSYPGHEEHCGGECEYCGASMHLKHASDCKNAHLEVKDKTPVSSGIGLSSHGIRTKYRVQWREAEGGHLYGYLDDNLNQTEFWIARPHKKSNIVRSRDAARGWIIRGEFEELINALNLVEYLAESL